MRRRISRIGERCWRRVAASFLLGCFGLGAAGEAPSPSSVSAPTPEQLEFFEARVRPLLVENCYGCHSAQAEKLRGDLRLDLKRGWEKGGASGHPAVIPGEVGRSPLLRAVRREDPEFAMPPQKKLSAAEIETLVAWVAMGAPDPRSGGPSSLAPTPEEVARNHWGFRPVREPALPEVRDAAWVKTPIDRFVLAGLERRGLRPAPPTDRRTLLRRASYVLTGLPPSFDQVRRFEQDTSPGAFDKVVDELLASPRYGERWGRHWLDVARYADTKGYVFEEERRYPYAYTYRDYVIRAFNEDKPYDRFLVEQIAADQVVTDDDRSALAAMGFLTLGRRFLNNPHDIIDDRIDVLMRGTMALTVGCARCHDHKYDPVPMADYYSLYGVFASSEEPAEKPLLGTIPDPERYEAFRKELEWKELERDTFVAKKEIEHRRKLRESVGDYLLAAHDAAALADPGKREELARGRQLSPTVLNRWIGALEGWKKEGHPLFDPWFRYEGLAPDRFAESATAISDGETHPALARAFAGGAPSSLRHVADRYNQVFARAEHPALRAFLEASGTPLALEGRELHGLFDVPEGQKKRALQRAVEELQATHPGAPPRGMVMTDKATPVEPVIFKRGNPGNRGDAVPRRFLGLFSGPDRKPFRNGSGRLELAQAIASPDNPLTSRVAVNRIWLQHFGEPLVATPADFGVRSDPPSHPELLDWLAARFVADGWSFKKLHRLILLSAAWQQSSAADPATVEADPDDRWLSRQRRRRLDFEALRDTWLSASGKLDLAMGGHGVEITTAEYANRRTVYGFVERQNLPGLFRTFDFASPDTSSSQRFRTTVPQQALFLMNSRFAMDQARRLAARPEVAECADPEARIERLYGIVLQRSPTAEERDAGLRYVRLAESTESSGAKENAGFGAWERYAQVLLMSNEAVFVD